MKKRKFQDQDIHRWCSRILLLHAWWYQEKIDLYDAKIQLSCFLWSFSFIGILQVT